MFSQGFKFSGTSKSGGGGSVTTLADAVAGINVCGQVSCNLAGGWNAGTRTLKNFITNPADGTSQTDGDFIAPEGKVPTFNTASPFNYFDNWNDANYLDKRTFASGDVLFDCTRTDKGANSQSWFVLVGRTPTTYDAAARAWIGGSGFADRQSNAIRFNTFGRPQRYLAPDGSHNFFGSNIAADTDFLWVGASDCTLGSGSNQTIRSWFNTKTQYSGSNFYPDSYLLDPLVGWRIGGDESSSQVLPLRNEERIAEFAWGYGFLTDAQAESIIDYYNDLCGLSVS